MTAFATAGAGFLLSVLWFDLMFDVQVLRARAPEPERLASIAGYYRRVTIQATPMNRLVALVMAGTIAALIAEVVNRDVPLWASIASLVLVTACSTLALAHTFANGARLGSGKHPPERQLALARLMLRDHLVCLAAIAAVLALQLAES